MFALTSCAFCRNGHRQCGTVSSRTNYTLADKRRRRWRPDSTRSEQRRRNQACRDQPCVTASVSALWLDYRPPRLINVSVSVFVMPCSKTRERYPAASGNMIRGLRMATWIRPSAPNWEYWDPARRSVCCVYRRHLIVPVHGQHMRGD